MVRFVGYLLGAIAGIAFVASSLVLFYELFIISEDEKSSSYGEELSILAVIVIFSAMIFTYVYQTGFGKSRLARVQEELEVLKLKQEMSKLKDS